MRVERTIRKYKMFTRHDHLLVAVSGGKDSLSLWDILHRLGYLADGLYINLGIDEGINYSEKSLSFIQSFASLHGLYLHVVNIPQEYGETIHELAIRTHRGYYKPCSVCGVVKRHVMSRIAHDKNYDVLLTGHNLDDEAAILFGNTLNWQSPYLLHQAPVIFDDSFGLTRKVKPLCRLYERETAAYALLNNIIYIHEECPYAQGSTTLYHKEILDKMEYDRPGIKLKFYLSFLQAKGDGLFSPAADKKAELMHNCPQCGQPTTTPDFCAFCRMFINKTIPEI